jgi:hypothetical protein
MEQERARMRRSGSVVATVGDRPWMGMRAERLQRRLERPMLIAASLVIPALSLERAGVGPTWMAMATVLNWASWLAFVAELVATLALVPDRRRYLLHNPINVAIVVLTPPFLPALFQSLRALRLLRLARLMRLAPILRLAFTPRGLRVLRLLRPARLMRLTPILRLALTPRGLRVIRLLRLARLLRLTPILRLALTPRGLRYASVCTLMVAVTGAGRVSTRAARRGLVRWRRLGDHDHDDRRLGR